MKNLFKYILLAVLLAILVSCGCNKISANKNYRILNSPNNLEVWSKEVKSEKFENSYVGCWSGMKGGRIEITHQEISDLNSKETSSFEEIETIKDNQYEKFLLKADTVFDGSFLNKYILIIFKNDGLSAINTYKSYEDFENDKFVGFGFFGEISCEKLKKMRQK